MMHLKAPDHRGTSKSKETRQEEDFSQEENDQDLYEEIYTELSDLETQQSSVMNMLNKDNQMLTEQIKKLEAEIENSLKIMEGECEGIEGLVNMYDGIVSASNMKRAQDVRHSQAQRHKNKMVCNMESLENELLQAQSRIRSKESELQKMYQEAEVFRGTNLAHKRQP